MIFGLFATEQSKMRATAKNWLELAQKVVDYRRDLLAPAELAELQAKILQVKQQVREKADAAKLKLSIEQLEAVLQKTGGSFYPKSGWNENIEFLVVAAIVILGVKAYFIQPFKIPTNSMWPSYNGMTAEVFRTREEEPGVAGNVFRKVTQLADSYRIDAPADGEIMFEVIGSYSAIQLQSREVPSRAWFVLPSKAKEYALWVGQERVTVTVPLDFDMEQPIRDAFFPELKNSKEKAGEDLARIFANYEVRSTVPGQARFMRTGKKVRKGERVLSFDILTGDMLFVDRVSYHFVRPSVGDGFVFRTDEIRSPYMLDRQTGKQVENYYIKRLVGLPGDKLEVKQYELYRNGVPIAGSPAFAKNARREGNYVGYRNEGILERGQTFTVPKDGYFAMGDNSANSLDSRFWGIVPAKSAIGRPLFIYYPFTRRWGVAP